MQSNGDINDSTGAVEKKKKIVLTLVKQLQSLIKFLLQKWWQLLVCK